MDDAEAKIKLERLRRIKQVAAWRDHTRLLYGPGGSNEDDATGVTVQWRDADAMLSEIDELRAAVARLFSQLQRTTSAR